MPLVTLPNGSSIDFPEGMSPDDMAAVIQNSFPELSPDEEEPKGIIASATDWIKDKLAIPEDKPVATPERVITANDQAVPEDNIPNETIASLPSLREEAGPGVVTQHSVVGVDSSTNEELRDRQAKLSEDVIKGVPAEIGRMGNLASGGGRLLENAEVEKEADLGIISQEDRDAVIAANDAAMHANEEEDKASYQMQTMPGKVLGSVVNLAPAVAVSTVNPVLGAGIMASQFGLSSGEEAINRGESLLNAQIKAAGGAALGSVLGEAVGGGTSKVLTNIPKIGEFFEPVAADTLTAIARRVASAPVSAATFQVAQESINKFADFVTDSTVDKETGKEKTYQWVPTAESIATFSLLHALPTVPEFARRNSLPKETTLLTDGQVVMGHSNGSLMSSPDAVRSFIDSNEIKGAEVVPVTGKMLHADGDNIVVGYAAALPITPTDAIAAKNITLPLDRQVSGIDDTVSKISEATDVDAVIAAATPPPIDLAALSTERVTPDTAEVDKYASDRIAPPEIKADVTLPEDTAKRESELMRSITKMSVDIVKAKKANKPEDIISAMVEAKAAQKEELSAIRQKTAFTDYNTDPIMDEFASQGQDVQEQADVRGRQQQFNNLIEPVNNRAILDENTTGRPSTARESADVLSKMPVNEIEERENRRDDAREAFSTVTPYQTPEDIINLKIDYMLNQPSGVSKPYIESATDAQRVGYEGKTADENFSGPVSLNPDWYKKSTVDAYNEENKTEVRLNNFGYVKRSVELGRQGLGTPAQQEVYKYMQDKANEHGEQDQVGQFAEKVNELEHEKGYVLGEEKEMPVSDLNPGDKVVVMDKGVPDELEHKGFDENGLAVLEDGQRIAAVPFDTIKTISDVKPAGERGYVNENTVTGRSEPITENQEGVGQDISVPLQEESSAPEAPALDGVKQPWEMTRDELYQHHEEARAKEDNIESDILGPYLDEWKKAQRQQGSSNDEVATQAARTIDEIESKLPQEQVDQLYGMGDKSRSADDVKAHLEAADHVDLAETPEELGRIIAPVLTKLPENSDPATMTEAQKVAVTYMSQAFQKAQDNGWNTQDITNSAINAAAGRYADPADAEFMLKRFLTEKPQPNNPNETKYIAGKVADSGEVSQRKAQPTENTGADTVAPVVVAPELTALHTTIDKAYPAQADRITANVDSGDEAWKRVPTIEAVHNYADDQQTGNVVDLSTNLAMMPQEEYAKYEAPAISKMETAAGYIAPEKPASEMTPAEHLRAAADKMDKAELDNSPANDTLKEGGTTYEIRDPSRNVGDQPATGEPSEVRVGPKDRPLFSQNESDYSRGLREYREATQDNPNDDRNMELVENSKKHFGTTTDPKKAGYILQDGTMLDFSGSHQIDKQDRKWMQDRIVDHRDLHGDSLLSPDTHLDIAGEKTWGMMEFMARTGAIRFDSASGLANAFGNPTSKQIESIGRHLRGKDITLELVDKDTARIQHSAEIDNATPMKVAKFFAEAKNKKVDETSPLYSRQSTPITGSTIPEVHAELTDFLGNGVANLQNRNKLEVVQKGDELPDNIRNFMTSGGNDADTEIKAIYSRNGDVAGAYDPNGGKVWLVADSIQKGDAKGVMIHEAAHALLAEDKGFQSKKSKILGDFDNLGKMGSKSIQEAMARVPEDTPDHLKTEEGLAYFLQSNPQHSLYHRVISAIKTALYRIGIPVTKLTESDMVSMFTRGAKSWANKGGEQSSMLGASGKMVDGVLPITSSTPESYPMFSVKSDIKPGESRLIKQGEEKTSGGVDDLVDNAKTTSRNILARLSELKDSFIDTPVYSDKKKIIGELTGKDQEIDFDTDKAFKKINKEIPAPRQRAIKQFMQAGGDTGLIEERIAALRAKGIDEKYIVPFVDALSLPDSDKIAAKDIYAEQQKWGQQAVESGILEHLLDNYVRGQWEREKQGGQRLAAIANSGILNEHPKEAMKKVFQNDYEGILAGYVPTDQRIGYQHGMASMAIRKAINAHEGLKGLLHAKEPDGMPVMMVGGSGRPLTPEERENAKGSFFVKPNIPPKGAVTADGRRYVHYDHPALRGWKWIGKDSADNNIMMHGDMWVHPDAVGDIHALLGTSAIRSYEIPENIPGIGGLRPGAAALKMGAYVKATILAAVPAPFHLAHISEHAVFHDTNPLNTRPLDFNRKASFGGKEYDVLREFVNHGGMLYSHSGLQQFGEGLSSGGVFKHIPYYGEMLNDFGEWQFKEIIPRIKAEMFEHAVQRDVAFSAKALASGKVTMDQIFQRQAKHSNDAFGEQNYKYMGRNPTLQDTFRLVVLAPDFLESRAKFFGAAFTPDGREQRIALIKGAVIMAAGAQFLNVLLGDDHKTHWSNPFSVIIGGREYQPRSVVGDIAHLVTDPRGFFYNRLNPLWGKPVIELASGRNQYSQKETVAEGLKSIVKSWVPIPVQGAFKNTTGQTKLQSITNALLQSVGIGSFVHKSAAERLVSDLNFGHMTVAGKSAIQKERYNGFAKIRDGYIDGKLNSMDDVRAEAKKNNIVLNKSQITQLRLLKDQTPKAKEKILEHRMKSFSADEVLEVWDKMDTSERETYKKFIIMKIIRSHTMPQNDKMAYVRLLNAK